MQTTADVPLHIRSPASASERRVTPSWSIAQLKARLEPITGIPASSQRLVLNLGGSRPAIPLEAADEERTQLASFPLQPYAEIYVSRTHAWILHAVVHICLAATKPANFCGCDLPACATICWKEDACFNQAMHDSDVQLVPSNHLDAWHHRLCPLCMLLHQPKARQPETRCCHSACTHVPPMLLSTAKPFASPGTLPEPAQSISTRTETNLGTSGHPHHHGASCVSALRAEPDVWPHLRHKIDRSGLSFTSHIISLWHAAGHTSTHARISGSSSPPVYSSPASCLGFHEPPRSPPLSSTPSSRLLFHTISSSPSSTVGATTG